MADDQDVTAIEQTLRTAAMPLRCADADWTNAFGTTLSGCHVIVAYLRACRRRALRPLDGSWVLPQISIRPVTHDVVVAKTYAEIAGHQTIDATELSIRRNHSLTVLARQPDGRWLMVSEMYMDARDEATAVSS